MHDYLHTLNKSYLSLKCTLEALTDLLDEMEDQSRLNSGARRALHRHTRLLLRLLADHITSDEEGLRVAIDDILTGACVLTEIRPENRALCRQFQAFYRTVDDLPEAIGTRSTAWRQLRDRLQACQHTFAILPNESAHGHFAPAPSNQISAE